MKSKSTPIFLALSLLVVFLAIVLRHQPEQRPTDSRVDTVAERITPTLPKQQVAAVPSSLLASTAPPRHLRLATPSIPAPDPQKPADLSSIAAFRDWIPSYLAAREEAAQNNSAVDPALVEEGRSLAGSRRPEIYKLIRENPGRALHESLPLRHWVALPDEIRALVEEPISGVGDYEVRSDCRPADQVGTPGHHTRFLTFGSQTAEAYVYGRREGLVSKNDIPVQGIHLAGRMALWDDTVQTLDPADLPAALELFEDGDPTSSLVSSTPLDEETTHTGLHGGKVHYFATPGELQTFASAVADLEALHGPDSVSEAYAVAAVGADAGKEAPFIIQVAASSAASDNDWSTTPKTVLAAIVVCSDQTVAADATYTPAELTAEYNSAAPQFAVQSFNRTTFTPTVANQVFVLPQTFAYYNEPPNDANGDPQSGSGLLRDDAIAAATAAGLNPDNFDLFAVWAPRIPKIAGSAAAFANVEGKYSWYWGSQGGGTKTVLYHEHIHNYGLSHANAWDGYTGTGFKSRIGNREHNEYGDPFDNMGQAYSSHSGQPVFPNGHVGMAGKTYLNWMSAGEFHTATNSGVYRVTRFDHQNANTGGAKLGLCVENADGNTIWAGLRENFTDTSGRAYIVWQNTDRAHRFIDTTPLSGSSGLQNDRVDGTLAVGQTWTDPTRTLRITNLGTGGTAPQEYIDLQVSLVDRGTEFELFTTASATSPGLTGTYFNQSPDTVDEDWRDSPVSGSRVDDPVDFPDNGWGIQSSVGLTLGDDDNWRWYAVQWDGFVRVNQELQIATLSTEGTRMWIDSDNNGSFDPEELVDGRWDENDTGNLERGDSSQLLSIGTYPIRIQYRDVFGDNSFQLVSANPSLFDVYTDSSLATEGLAGSYVDASLRSTDSSTWTDGSQTISGTRVEYPFFTSKGWGERASVGLTGGEEDDDWDNFSTQWDGGVVVGNVPVRFATIGSNGSRLWVDVDNDGFGSGLPDFVNNGWGTQQSAVISSLSGSVDVAGWHAMRIQYETTEAPSSNSFRLLGISAEPSDDHGGSTGFATTLPDASLIELPGKIEYGGDHDYFRIDLAEAGQLRVYSTSLVDLYGTLFDSNGVPLTSNDDGQPGYDLDFEIATTITEPGSYYIRVRGFSSANTGSYDLHSEFTPGLPLDIGVDQPGITHDAGQNSLITPIAVTQTQGDSLGTNYTPTNLINNSGLSSTPFADASNYHSISHTGGFSNGTWVTDTATFPNYFNGVNPDPKMVFTLDSVTELSAMVIWGYAGVTNEASDFRIEFSEDGGNSYRRLVNVQTESLIGSGVTTLDFGNETFRADVVRVTMTENAAGRGFPGGGGDRVGLAEVKFLGSRSVAPWSSFADESFDGASAGRSGMITHNQESSFQQTFTGPGELCWWWKVSSERNFDRLRVYLDGAELFNIHGEVDWEEASISIPPGTHTVRWSYTKDATISNGADAGWVDQIQFTNAIDFALNASVSNAGSGGFAPWIAQSTVTKDGVSALRSGTVGDVGTSQLRIDVTGPGAISFWWKTDASPASNVAVFLIPSGQSAANMGQLSGIRDWTPHSFDFPAGDHTILFQYANSDAAGTSSVDAAYLDLLSISGETIDAEMRRLPNGRRQITFASYPAKTYAVEHSEDLLSWKRVMSAISSPGTEASALVPLTLAPKIRGFFRVVSEE